jgi:hypothetical protein
MNSTKCAKCGLVNFATASECKRCGSALGALAAQGGWSHTFGGGAGGGQQGWTQPSPGAARAGASVSADGLYYKPSGEVTVAGLAAGLLGGLVVGLVLTFAYAYLLIYVPFVYAHVLCTVFYALGLGAVVGCLLKAGKMRNHAVGVFTAGAVALLSYYFCWAVWLSAVLARADLDVSVLTLASRPATLLDLILKLNETGAWSVGRKGVPVTGVLLWVVWGAEALTVLVGPTVMASAALTSEPFCESCDEWCYEDKGLVTLADAKRGELRRRLEAKDFEYLKTVGARKEGEWESCRLSLYHCKQCDRTNALTVKHEKTTFDSKGRSKTNSNTFVNQLLLTASEAEDLRRVSRELTRPAHAQAPASAVA